MRRKFSFRFSKTKRIFSDRNNGNTSQKIRSHHETLTRENEKLARQLYQRSRAQPSGGQINEKRVYVIEEEEPVRCRKSILSRKQNEIVLGESGPRSSTCLSIVSI